MENLCNLCPNKCGVNRETNLGVCQSFDKLKIAKYYLHPFEEPCLSGGKGSGTVFLCGCGLRCVFCQNYDVSRVNTGKFITVNELADIFKQLEDMGANNINIVNPSHYIYKLIQAFEIYRPKIPVVYNTHSYETVETLKLIDPYVDIYLPDLKFYASEISKRYTGKSNYFEYASKAVKFMMSSKKSVFENGLMKSGVILRHLIMPLCTEDSIKIIDWFYYNKQNDTYFSLMAQYTPFGNIANFPELNRKITERENKKVLNFLLSKNIINCFIQERKSADIKFIPKWDF